MWIARNAFSVLSGWCVLFSMDSALWHAGILQLEYIAPKPELRKMRQKKLDASMPLYITDS